ncbi:hypothetical protein ACOSP7_016952 [Xanthoceras sorbifolium]
MNPCADMHSTMGPARSERQQAEGNKEGEVIVALNRKFHKRLAKYSNLEILQERGIQLEELMDIVVQIVDVFENGGAVYVRGRQVHMTVKAINDYYRLDTDADHVDWEALNPKCIAYRDALAQDLGTIRQPTRTSSGIVMFREQLKLDSAFWNEFSYYSVLPSEQGAILSKKMACFIYAIRHNLPINIGYLIRQSIAKMGKVGVGKICFPSLITHFYAAARVDVYGEDEIVIQPPLNLDRATYNALGRGQHDPEFVLRCRVRSRINEDLVAGGHDPEANQSIPPAWAAAMFNSLERRLDGLKGDINDKF